MPWFEFFWTPDIIAHLAEHGVTVEEFEHVVGRAKVRERSDSSDRIMVRGFTLAGRWLHCFYELIDDITVLPVTGYEPEEE